MFWEAVDYLHRRSESEALGVVKTYEVSLYSHIIWVSELVGGRALARTVR
jgi:hypothetical protein